MNSTVTSANDPASEQTGEPASASPYAVTVILPCRNERDSIERCVGSILSQERPKGNLEIIVVDGLSEDGTPELLARLAHKYPSLKVLTNPAQIMPAGVNIGIQAAQGRYIAIMGAHNRYASDYLSQSVRVLEDTKVDNVGGSMICEGGSYVQQAIALAHHSGFSVGGARWHNPEYEGPADTVFGGVYRREVFDRIGLFDEELIRNQDDEFNLRLVQQGGKIWHSPRIKSWYSPRRTLSALFRQYLQYGYWRVRVIQKRKAAASVRQFVPGMFVLSLLTLPLVGILWSPGWWFWLAAATSYILCAIGVSLGMAARHGLRFSCILPAVFACYHLGYGLGFVHGLWDFVLLRRGPSKLYTSLTRSTGSSDNLRASYFSAEHHADRVKGN